MLESGVIPATPDNSVRTDADWRQVLAMQGQDKSERIALLVKLLETPLTLPPRERLAVGDELAQLGDPRPGVGLRADHLPDVDWVDIPDDCEFMYGEGESDHYIQLPPYKISRYPITYAQFQAFIDAPDGYYNPHWWKGLSVSDEHRAAPGDQAYKVANHPRERVSWYDAVAFCRWGSVQLGYEIRLPTEWEWEKAARGPNGRRFPWGSEYIIGYANIDESYDASGTNYLKVTSPVGMYPQGKSPYGVLDMSGNVWEWCMNEHQNPTHLNVRGDKTRVLRGGSWHYYSENARGARRFWYDPNLRDNGCGFRVVAAPVPRLHI